MSAHRSSKPFPPAVTWLGVLILSSALATSGSARALAATGPIATSSMSWTGIDNDGVLRGGLPVDYSSGRGGWGSTAFDSAGIMGIEWTTIPNPTRRVVYFSASHSQSVNPGSESSLSTFGYTSPMPSQVLETTTTTRVSGDQAQWTVRLVSTSPDAMTGNRFFWIADLLDGYDSVFTTPHNQTLVVSDTQGLHPTMVLHAASTAGTVVWGGAERYTAPLVNGENKPTLYVHSTDEMDITITITAGIIDHDPCSGQAALALANTSATVYGTAWPTFTSCLGSPQWDPIEAGSNPQSLSLELDPRVPELEPHQTRELTITGLPAGVTWTPESLTPPHLTIELTADASVPPGDYPLVFDVVTRSEFNSVVSYSHALNTTGSLTITPAPAPEPKPEPEPESELGVEEDIEESIESVVPVLIGESSSSGSRVLLNEPSVVVEPVVTSRALTPPQPIEEITGAFVVPATPAERELFTPRERVPSYSPVIPEPSAASAWLGVSLAIAAALAGIFALLRRRSEEQEE